METHIGNKPPSNCGNFGNIDLAPFPIYGPLLIELSLPGLLSDFGPDATGAIYINANNHTSCNDTQFTKYVHITQSKH